MVLPSQVKYFHKQYRPKLISVAVPIRKGEKAFSMRNCPLDYSDTEVMEHFKSNDIKEECTRRVDFEKIAIRHVGPEERNKTWNERKQQEAEEEMEGSVFR